MRVKARAPQPAVTAPRPDSAPVQRKQPPRDPYAVIDALYQEITAPRAELAQLIVDPRPERAHPLLTQEVRALRQRAHMMGAAPVSGEVRGNGVAISELSTPAHGLPPVRDTLAEGLPAQAPGLRKPRRSRPPSTAALHAMVRAGFVIGRGFNGREVLELKALMQRRNINVSDGPLFDDLTHDQLLRFQHKHGIAPSGLINADTLAALEGRRPSQTA